MSSTDSAAFGSNAPFEATGTGSRASRRFPREWLTCGEVAREAGVTSRTVQNWCDRGLLRCERLQSGHRRIPAAAWHVFRAGGSWEEQGGATARESAEELDARIRRAASPQEVMEILLQMAPAPLAPDAT